MKIPESIKKKAEKVSRDPKKLDSLVNKAQEKAKKNHSRFFSIWDDLLTLLRFLKQIAKGAYKDFSWGNVVLIVSSLIYLVSPLDFLPDLLPGGLLDDAFLIGWVIQRVKDEIDRFKDWENNRLN